MGTAKRPGKPKGQETNSNNNSPNPKTHFVFTPLFHSLRETRKYYYTSSIHTISCIYLYPWPLFSPGEKPTALLKTKLKSALPTLTAILRFLNVQICNFIILLMIYTCLILGVYVYLIRKLMLRSLKPLIMLNAHLKNDTSEVCLFFSSTFFFLLFFFL